MMTASSNLTRSNNITLSLEQLLNLTISDSKEPITVTINNDTTPLNIHFTGTVGITTDKNLMIASPNGITNINPLHSESNEPVSIEQLDSYSAVQQENLKHVNENVDDTTCLLHGKYISYEELISTVERLTKLTEILMRHVPQSLLLEEELKCLE